jgi:hypothetical protein
MQASVDEVEPGREEAVMPVVERTESASAAEEKAALRDLRRIPGVGPSIARDLWNQGFRRVADLRGRDPQAMYERACEIQGMHVDRCLLYVFRCAVYFASHDEHEPDRLLWWNWKDGKMDEERSPTR